MSIQHILCETDASGAQEKTSVAQADSVATKPQKFLCLICNVDTSSQNRTRHERTIKHQKAMMAAHTVNPVGPGNGAEEEGFCGACETTYAASDRERHEASLQHRRLLSMMDPIRANMHYCAPCGFSVHIDNLRKHRQSAAHRKGISKANAVLEEASAAPVEDPEPAPSFKAVNVMEGARRSTTSRG